jgi:hypothetical protein
VVEGFVWRSKADDEGDAAVVVHLDKGQSVREIKEEIKTDAKMGISSRTPATAAIRRKDTE